MLQEEEEKKKKEEKEKEGPIGGFCEDRCFASVPTRTPTLGPQPSLIGRALEEEVRTMRPSELSGPQERLVKPRIQLLSLLSALLAAITSLWSLRDPDACVTFTEEQAYTPKRCKALKDYADANTHLLGFCYRNCGESEVKIYACALIFAMLLQSLTVLPSHCHCGSTFLRVTWRVDLTGDLAELEELAVQRGQSWIWRRIQAWTGEQRGNLFDWLERLLQKQSKMLPLHMTVIHKASMFWLLIALLELLLHTASSVRLTQAVVSFECESVEGEELLVQAPVHNGLLEVTGQIVTLLLLSASLYLGNRAQWRICLEVPAALLADVLNVTAHGAALCSKNKHPTLSRVCGKELLDLRCLDGSPLPLTRFKQWPDGLVYAQFGLYAEKPTMLVRRRKYLLVLGGLTMILLFGASSSCWGCINEISLPNTGGLFDVEAQLLLLGSCGRHNGSGIPCLLGALCIGILLLAQLVILAAGPRGESLQDDDQMAVTLLDFREYQENLIHGLYAGESVRSHVWLCPKGEGWQVANFLDSDYEDRSQWRRSQSVVSGVRIVQEPDDDLWNLVHSRGLPTEEGPSTVYVQFDAEPGDEDPRGGRRAVRQMVPVDFLPGAFFCSVSVGRRAAWSNLSMLCAGAALALIGFDLSFHLSYSLQGTLLKDCEDILSGRCLELEPRPGGRQVASGLGVYLAILSGLGVAASMVILRALN
ncbi:unnamed protein product [Durusdinium trenchii]|uniref:Uncharacterized protein n=1 Tax=Durusdinium trenchii TaxID=1381693 RepID=A0ABP0QGZ8_9DINO